MQENYERRGSQRFNRLSPAVFAWGIGACDFCLVLTAAAVAFAAHYDVVDAAGPGRHLFIALVAGLLFVGGFERLDGYRLRQLSKLEWQLTRIFVTWGILISVLLFIAFISKISGSYSRGWMLGWIVSAIGMQLTARCFLAIATQRWPHSMHLARHI